MVYLRMNCSDKDHENESNPSRASIMLKVLNARAKYANEINWIDTHFESVMGSNLYVLKPARSKRLFPHTDKHFFAEFSVLLLSPSPWMTIRVKGNMCNTWKTWFRELQTSEEILVTISRAILFSRLSFPSSTKWMKWSLCSARAQWVILVLLSLSITLALWKEDNWLNARIRQNLCVLSDELEHCHVMIDLLRSSVSTKIDQKFPSYKQNSLCCTQCVWRANIFF